MKDLFKSLATPMPALIKTYCMVIAHAITKNMNKVTNEVQFKVNKDHYTANGYYLELDDGNSIYEIKITTRKK